MFKKDTIAAIATGMTGSGIGIVRISGEDAISIADKVFVSKKDDPSGQRGRVSSFATHTIHYGCIYDNDEKIDEVLLTLMKGPGSYTGEDTVEINCHGGLYVCKRILETVLKYGARLAEPGEYTKRAFLNGRMDLSQAEAVMDLIASDNEFARKNSLDQLSGSLYKKIKEMREDLLYEIAFIESAIDDPEHFDLEGYGEKLLFKTEKVRKKVAHMLLTADDGRIRKEGIKTVILGKPNAGKSSLLNMLSGTERAIVTEIAGTTRDTLEESVRIGEYQLLLIDTAGIRESEDKVEKIGIQRALENAKDADLILYVMDASVRPDENDQKIMEFLKENKKIRGNKSRLIILLNKSDLEEKTKMEEIQKIFGKDQTILSVSALEQAGKDSLLEALRDFYKDPSVKYNEEVIITNERQKEELEGVIDSLDLVKNSIESGLPEDFYSIDLMDAYKHLGNIIGEELEDDLADEIFSRFCMGK